MVALRDSMIGGFFSKKKQKDTATIQPAETVPQPIDPAQGDTPPAGVDLTTGLRFRDNVPYFVVRIKNKSPDALGDISVNVDGTRMLLDIPRSVKGVKILEPGQSAKLAFRLVPRLVTGAGKVTGNISYFDVNKKARDSSQLPPQDFSLPIPRISPMKVSEDQWRVKTANMKKFELETKDISIAPATFFSQASIPLRTLGMFMLDPIETPTLYRGVARYMGLDGNKNMYGAEIQVIGKENRCRALIVTYGPEDTLAMGLAFYQINALRSPPNFKKLIVNPATSSPL